MSKEIWSAVDAYYTNLLISPDPIMEETLLANREAGLPDIHVSPLQGKLLFILASMMQARNILEIGTLGGYSAIWLARALPNDGKLITLESNLKHALVAASNISRAGLADKVDIRFGPASETLAELADQSAGPFDLVFIDADKPGYADYLRWSLKLCYPGSVILADNVVRNGDILDSNSQDQNIKGIQAFNEALASIPNVTATVMQTVGGKGYDGFMLIYVTA